MSDDETVGGLRVVREEARETIDKQYSSLTYMNEQSNRFLRFDLLILGFFVTVLSFISQPNIELQTSLLNPLSVVGLGFLVFSIALATKSLYDSTTLTGGIDSRTIDPVLEMKLSEEVVLQDLVRAYGEWIEDNQRVVVRRAGLMIATLMAMIYSISFLAMGMLQAILGPLQLWWIGLIVVALLYVTYESELFQHLYVSWNNRPSDSPFRNLPSVASGTVSSLEGEED